MCKPQNDPCSCLLVNLQPYKDKLDELEAESAAWEWDFITRVERVVDASVTPRERQEKLQELVMWSGTLPCLYEPASQYYGVRDRLLEEKVLPAIEERICKEFNPTGKTAYKCLCKWINEKLRLQYMLFTEYQKYGLDLSFDPFGNNKSAPNNDESTREEIEISRQLSDYINNDPDRKLRSRFVPGGASHLCNKH